jgi:hypothetical protein
MRLLPWHRITIFSRQRQIECVTVVLGAQISFPASSVRLSFLPISVSFGSFSTAGVLFCLFGLVRVTPLFRTIEKEVSHLNIPKMLLVFLFLYICEYIYILLFYFIFIIIIIINTHTYFNYPNKDLIKFSNVIVRFIHHYTLPIMILVFN